MKKNKEDDHEVTDYLIFKVGNNNFSIVANSVVEVISEHELTELPFVPDYIDGLINMKGQIIPQLNLNKLFFSNDEYNEFISSELIIVETSRSPCVLKIDSLLGKYSIKNQKIKNILNESVTSINHVANDELMSSSNLNKYIVGEFSWYDEIVLILEPSYFGEVVSSKENPVGEKGLLGRNESLNISEKNETIDCLVVNNCQEKYALELKDILEIIETDEITTLPGSPHEVVGITMVRDNPLVVLSLSRMLGKIMANEISSNIVIIERGETIYGLQVDGIESIYYFDSDSLQTIDDDNAELSGVLTTDANEIIGLIRPENLICEEQHSQFIKYVPERIENEIQEDDKFKSVLQVIIGSEEYAIPLEDINKIVEYKKPEVVSSEVNEKIVGAVDINGAILPVVDIDTSSRRNQEPDNVNIMTPDAAKKGFVIIGIENKKWALQISEAKEIIDLPLKNIEESSDADSGFIDGIANIGEQLISLINVQAIFKS